MANDSLLTHTYLIETCKQFEGKRQFSISFDEADLGREKTLTAILSSHEQNVAAWLMPKVFPASLVVSFHQQSYKRCEKKLPTSPPGSDTGAFKPGGCSSRRLRKSEPEAAINPLVHSKKHRIARSTKRCEARHIW